MSSVFITNRPAAEAVVTAATPLLRFSPSARAAVGGAGSFSMGVTWVDPVSVPVLHLPEAGISIAMLGRVYDPADGVRYDRKLEAVAAQYRGKGPAALYPINGGGGLVLLDHKKDQCLIVTDTMGFFPLYAAFQGDARRTAVCTHPDVLAASYEEPLKPDTATMAELVSTCRGVHPYTFYEDIHQLDPGSVYAWDRDGLRKLTEYWRPECRLDPHASIDNLAEELAAALREAVTRRVGSVSGNIGLFLSGGLDSRALLFATEQRNRMTGVTFYSRMNRETRYARNLAHLAGIQQQLLRRDFDQYGNAAVNTVRTSGGLWDLLHAHAMGLTDQISDMGFELVLTGCYMDYLFKALAVDTDWSRTSRFAPDRQRLGKFRYHWDEPHYSLDNLELARKVRERLDQTYSGLDLDHLTPETRMALQYRRLCPMSREGVLAFQTTMWRTLPFDLVTADTALLEVFLRTPPEITLNNRLFIKALHRLSPELLKVPDSNFGQIGDQFSVGGLLRKIGAKVRRDTRKLLHGSEGLANEGSWINWDYYLAHSSVIRDLWNEVKEKSGDAVREILGSDPFARSLEDWARDEHLFTRTLTLGIWLTHRINRAEFLSSARNGPGK